MWKKTKSEGSYKYDEYMMLEGNLQAYVYGSEGKSWLLQCRVAGMDARHLDAKTSAAAKAEALNLLKRYFSDLAATVDLCIGKVAFSEKSQEEPCLWCVKYADGWECTGACKPVKEDSDGSAEAVVA